ncbi:amidase [Microvirga sp. GCM10011540]|uniref:amidase n=1 Tax=Microvirga sp. GCM10011540 TaxID=3317338 RepID=UPI003621B708
MSEITSLSAVELSAAIHARTLSCREVMVAYLEQIRRINPVVNAIVSLRDEGELINEAGRCDEQLAAGQPGGWMHGFPIAVKDLSPVKGIRCTFGSPLFADFIPEEDATHVERMKKAGAIIIGKTNTPEMGLGSHTYNPVFGRTRNPYNTSKSAGGSSGGAAAALAARLVPVADGSDMMGSLRNPAAFNNVVGFRPTYGRVPSGPSPELFLQNLSTTGPMGRSVQDVAKLLVIQAGYDIREPSSWSGVAIPPSLNQDSDALNARIGWLGDFGGYLPFESGILDLNRKALSLFEAMGCAVENVTVEFDMSDLWKAWLTLRHWLVAGKMQALYADPANRDRIKPELAWEIESGLSLTGGDVYAASLVRSNWYRYMCRLFECYDYLILPSAQVFPFDVEINWPAEVAGRKMDTYHRWMEVVVGPSMAGLPVAAMPAGFGESGLPNGFQIVGKPHADMSVLQLAHAYEERADWLTASPALLRSSAAV